MINYILSFTKKADKDEANIYQYIKDEFGELYAEKFRANFIQVCNLLIKQPFIRRTAKNNAAFKSFYFQKGR